MTNFETALQTLVGRFVHVRLRVESTTAGETQPYEIRCKVQEVMTDSFVGEWEGYTIYVPFHAVALIYAVRED